uniref:Calcium-dependent protein kinase-like n=1 Tax=Saccoglossus kowalevskii TaxID=10224 RepID=A0ABM0MXW3_SACKO|nr:PREDICTED: calcium-dependent protein kinase-like [Saccoglossus kowalevskii]
MSTGTDVNGEVTKEQLNTMDSEAMQPPDSGEKDQEKKMRNENNAQFIVLLKDKESLKKQIESKDQELEAAKCNIYDLSKKIEKLEEESKKKTPSVRQKDTVKHPTARQKIRKQTSTSTVAVKDTAVTEAPAPAEKDTYKYYSEIAEQFPNIKLSTVLSAEKKFIEADTDSSGSIDADELESLLDKNDLLFTKQQIRDILKEVDRDNSNDLDFFECLAVIEKLQTRRKTNLPPSIQNAQSSKSAVCTLQ